MASATRPRRSRTGGSNEPQVPPLPISYLIANLARAISRELSRDRLPGVAAPQIAPLLLLAREPGLSNAQLARRLHVSPQSMNEVIIDLEREGLIRRRVDGANRRILRAELTAAGRRQLTRWEAAIAGLEQRLFAGLSKREVDSVTRLLEHCVENMRVRRTRTERSSD